MIITLIVITVIGICIYNWDKKKQEKYIKSDSFKNHFDTLNKEQEKKQRKTNLQEKNESMMRMANNMGISIEDVKENYISDLEKKNIGTDCKDQMIQQFDIEKIKESKVFGIKAKNTGSAFMSEWFLEFINAKENQQIDNELINSEIQPQNNNQEIKKYVNQKRMHASFSDADLLHSFEKGSYEKGTLNQIVLEEILKERGLIPCSAHEKKKHKIKKELEERMENSVIEVCKSNPMINTPLAIVPITEAINTISEVYKKTFIERKDETGLNEFEITVLIEETKKKVFNNLIKH